MNQSDLKGKLPLVARGKVRELYELPDNRLLFVATDRISAYDVILNNGIPGKGKILTGLSRFWFNYLKDVLPNHLADNGDVLAALPEDVRNDSEIVEALKDRALVVNKYKILPIEVIVRGYITGSAWAEYVKKGTVHGIEVPANLQESQAFPTPLYTPSTKAEQGEHDENISPEQAAKIMGDDVAKKVEAAALELYRRAHDYALTRGIIIADTKFEFGLDSQGELVLVDEVLTPDSSRFWPKDTFKLGETQDSFDKQFVRNWLTDNGLKGKEDVTVPPEVVEATQRKYSEVYEKLVR